MSGSDITISIQVESTRIHGPIVLGPTLGPLDLGGLVIVQIFPSLNMSQGGSYSSLDSLS